MARQKKVSRQRAGLRALIGTAIVAIAVLAGAAWHLHPNGAAARSRTTTSAVTAGRAAGGTAELHQEGASSVVNGPRTSTARAQDDWDNPIIGAWETHAVSTTAGVQANLLAFLPGGVMIHAASNFPQSAGIGAWYADSDGTVVYTFTYRRMDKSTGAYIGSTRVHARVTVAPDGLSYDSPLGTELTDVDGNVTSTGQGTSHATRLVATPPDTSGIFASLAGTTLRPAGAYPVSAAASHRSSAVQSPDASCTNDTVGPHFC